MARHVNATKLTPAEVVRQVLTALEAGREEVLADELTRRIKAGLSNDPGVYLNFDSSRAFKAASYRDRMSRTNCGRPRTMNRDPWPM